MNARPPATDSPLAEGFAQHVERWARRHGAPEATCRLVRDVARELSAATAAGHVCLELAHRPVVPERADDRATHRAALLDSGVVGTPDAPGARPLVLDDADRLYLHRYFDYERRLARRLVRASRYPFNLAPLLPALRRLVAEGLTTAVVPGPPAAAGASDTSPASASTDPEADPVDWQRIATALALRNRLTVVSGGPGTGKTSTVVQLLACVLAQDPDCRVALAAPTGKAATRLSEAVRRRADHLSAALRARLPTSASTVHRLLGMRPGVGGFVHHAGHPLPLDLLVVDEASMLDLALATHLFEAVPDAARIVLLGDKDQLAAVESGAVFAELGTDPSLGAACVADLAAITGMEADRIRPPRPAPPAAPWPAVAEGVADPTGAPRALADSVVWLTRNYRFAIDSGIGRLAALVNAGGAAAALEGLRGASDAGVRWLDDDGTRPSAAALATMQDGYAPFAEAVAHAPGDVAAATAAFERFRVLCATREGARGVTGLNEVLEQWFRASIGVHTTTGDAASAWYLGRPVLVRRNDPVLRLFNGDIGLTLPDREGVPMVHFAQADGGFRAVAPVRLPAHETAFAMTVHKSQGSEFDAVLLMLPERPGPLLTRELVYTALTRARERVTLCASQPVLAGAIERATRRRSGLADRLRECAAAAHPDGAAPVG